MGGERMRPHHQEAHIGASKLGEQIAEVLDHRRYPCGA
jgi:hypothetical protein